MKRTLVILSVVCSACVAKPPTAVAPAEVLMTAAGQGDECLLTLDNHRFLTQRLESAALTERLRQLRGHTVVLQFVADAPYRCVGSAIITLQRAKVKFRVPQLPPE